MSKFYTFETNSVSELMDDVERYADAHDRPMTIEEVLKASPHLDQASAQFLVDCGITELETEY